MPAIVQNLLFLVLGAILGAIFSAWVSIYLKRPQLKIVGGGGGGGASGPGYFTNHVRVENRPGLWGIRLEELTIFGKGRHRPFEKGITVDRDPARECVASIHDKETGQRITHLWWRSLANPGQLQASVKAINSAESWDLMIFARLNAEPLRYFIYQSANGQFDNVVVPHEEVKFHDTKRFVVRINYDYDRRKLEFEVTVRKGYDGRLYIDGSMF